MRPFQEYKHLQFDFQILIQACKMKLRPTIPESCPAPLQQLIRQVSRPFLKNGHSIETNIPLSWQCWHENRDSRYEAHEVIKILEELQEDYRRNPDVWNSALKK